MLFEDLIKNANEIPENLEEIFLSNLNKTLKELFKKENDDFISFLDGFLNECGHEIYDFHLKTFTKDELWKSILISKTKEYKKMVNFIVDYNKYLAILMSNFEEKGQDKKEDKKLQGMQLKDIKDINFDADVNGDECWTTK